MDTPYGHRFEWLLPTNNTPIVVHLKDPSKVKNKKVRRLEEDYLITGSLRRAFALSFIWEMGSERSYLCTRVHGRIDVYHRHTT